MDLEAWKMMPANNSSISSEVPTFDSYKPEEEDDNGGLPF